MLGQSRHLYRQKLSNKLKKAYFQVNCTGTAANELTCNLTGQIATFGRLRLPLGSLQKKHIHLMTFYVYQDETGITYDWISLHAESNSKY